MNFYETIFILDAPSEVIDAEIQKVADLITANKGEVVNVDRWGMKKLAYEIKKKTQGYYTCVYFKGDQKLPNKLESHYKLDEHCLRYLTVVSIHTPEEIAARAAKTETAARTAAPAAAAPPAKPKEVQEAVSTPEGKDVPEAAAEPIEKTPEEEAEPTESVAEEPDETPEEFKPSEGEEGGEEEKEAAEKVPQPDSKAKEPEEGAGQEEEADKKAGSETPQSDATE